MAQDTSLVLLCHLYFFFTALLLILNVDWNLLTSAHLGLNFPFIVDVPGQYLGFNVVSRAASQNEHPKS